MRKEKLVMEGALTGRALPAGNAQTWAGHPLSRLHCCTGNSPLCRAKRGKKGPLGEQGKELLSLFKQCVMI